MTWRRVWMEIDLVLLSGALKLTCFTMAIAIDLMSGLASMRRPG